MISAALLLATSLQAQTPAPPARPAEPAPAPSAPRVAQAPASGRTEAAATDADSRAAERAATAAERAADASTRLAEAIEKLAEATARANAAATTAEATAQAAKADEAAKAKAGQWDVNITLGLISLTGNASTLTVNGLANAQRKTENWIYSVKAFGAYGRSRAPEVEGEPEQPSQVVALNAGIELRGDRRFTQHVSGYLLAGADTDHVKSVEARPFGEAGASLLWWDEKRPDGRESTLRTDLAFRYARETRFQYYPTRLDLPDVDLGGPRFGAMFRYGISQSIVFQEDVEVLLSVIGDSRVLVNSQTQLSAKLTEALSLGVGFLVKSDSAPPPGKVSTDTALSFNFTVAL